VITLISPLNNFCEITFQCSKHLFRQSWQHWLGLGNEAWCQQVIHLIRYYSQGGHSHRSNSRGSDYTQPIVYGAANRRGGSETPLKYSQWSGCSAEQFHLSGATYVQSKGNSYIVSFPDHFSPHGKNWSGERPIPFSFPAIAKLWHNAYMNVIYDII